eukprot:49062-Hanusia_phi.AAC.1
MDDPQYALERITRGLWKQMSTIKTNSYLSSSETLLSGEELKGEEDDEKARRRREVSTGWKEIRGGMRRGKTRERVRECFRG